MRIVGIPLVTYKESKGCEQAPKVIKGFLGEELVMEELPLSSDFSENYKAVQQAGRKEDFSLFVGGDQSITYPLVKSFAAGKQNPGIILFDAHADCNPDYKTPLYNDLIIALVENNVIPPRNILLVGSRAVGKQEERYLKQAGITQFPMNSIMHEGKDLVCDAFMARARSFSDLYVSVDIDVVDPAFAPGVGVPEPAGLSSAELVYFLQRLRFLNNWRAAEIVEVNPSLDKRDITCKLAARLVNEIAQYKS